MTLLEALLALGILATSAAGYLELFGASARSVRDAEEWGRTVAIAESVMEAASLGGAARTGDVVAGGMGMDDGYRHVVERRPWRGQLREVVVTVTSPRGTAFTLRRLAREEDR